MFSVVDLLGLVKTISSYLVLVKSYQAFSKWAISGKTLQLNST